MREKNDNHRHRSFSLIRIITFISVSFFALFQQQGRGGLIVNGLLINDSYNNQEKIEPWNDDNVDKKNKNKTTNNNKDDVDDEIKTGKKKEEQETMLQYYYELEWDNLPLDLQDAATILGYTKMNWDSDDDDDDYDNYNDEHGEKTTTTIIDDNWDDLTEAQQIAAMKFGHTKESWDNDKLDDDASLKVCSYLSQRSCAQTSKQELIADQQQQQQQQQEQRLPNVLFLMTDQQRFDAIRRVQDELERYNNVTKIRTPNLDRLSRRGVYFRNAYTQCSVCGPARTSLRTGLTIERSGIQTNRVDEYEESAFFENRVKNIKGLDHYLVEDLGYHSEYYGKLHIPNTLFKNSKLDFDFDDDDDDKDCSIISFNHYDFKKQQFVFETKDWGWSTKYQYRRLLNQKIQYDGDNLTRIMEDGMQIDTFSGYPYTPINVDSRYGHPINTTLLGHRSNFPDYLQTQSNVCGNFSLSENYTPSYFTGSIATKALQRLMATAQKNHTNGVGGGGGGGGGERGGDDYDDDTCDTGDSPQPFFLTVSFHHPHAPMVPAWKFLKYYWEHRDTLFVPPSIHDSLKTSPYDHSNGEEKYSNAEHVQEWTALYYALVEEIDDYIGQILDQLDSIPDVADNTLIMFTSDHGEMLGSHGKREKNNFFEEAARVPLMMALPGFIPKNIVVDDLTSHIDVASTILDYVGVPSTLYEDKNDGKSLRRFIEKKTYNNDYDESIVVNEWDFRDPVKSKDQNRMELNRQLDHQPSFLIRKGPFKLMMHKKSSSKQTDGLYNLAMDPFEMTNLLASEEKDEVDGRILEKAEHLRCLLLDWMKRMDGKEGYYSDPAANFGEGEGDIEEIRKRQSWRPLDFWVSDLELEFGDVVWDGDSFVRKEYLYFGIRAPGPLSSSIVANVSIEGLDAEYFTVDNDTIEIPPLECVRLQVVFSSFSAVVPVMRKTSLDAFLWLRQENADDNRQIKLLLSGRENEDTVMD